MRVLTLLCVLTAALTGGLLPASAENTRLPAFDAKAHVFIAPQVAKRFHLPADFANRLRERTAQQPVYVVAVEQGDELKLSDMDKWAGNIIDGQLLDQWTRQSADFDETNSIVILYVLEKGSTRGSTSMHVGDYYLLNRGITPSSPATGFSADNSALQSFMERDPATGILLALGDVDRGVSQATAEPFSPATAIAFVLVVLLALSAFVAPFAIVFARLGNMRDLERARRERFLLQEP